METQEPQQFERWYFDHGKQHPVRVLCQPTGRPDYVFAPSASDVQGGRLLSTYGLTRTERDCLVAQLADEEHTVQRARNRIAQLEKQLDKLP